MKLIDYSTLIQNLPVRQQCFTTKRTTWLNAENQFDWLNQLNNNLFGDKETLTISRQDILDTNNLRSKVIKTIYWGYPRGMRGNHFMGILNGMNQLVSSLNNLLQKGNIDEYDFNEFRETVNQIEGLGLSTYSKILYFADISIEGHPCLILDKRLMDVFNNNIFCDFSFPRLRIDNAQGHYIAYLEQLNTIEENLTTEAENIEQFLFIFGNSIKG